MANYHYSSSPLAVGGEKVVYVGRCVETGLDVVVKFLREPYTPADRDRFRQEIERMRRAKATTGAAITTIIDYNLDWHPPFYVEEYYPDGTLAQKMADIFSQGYVFHIAPALGYCRQILIALSGVHASNQIHRDVKPSNVLWQAATKRLILSDMGIGRTLSRPTNLQTRGMMGTLGYAAPEQELAGSGGYGVDHRADLYAIGVILHEMLTGQRGAWNHMTFNADYHVGQLLRGLLAFDRNQRFASAQSVIDYINALGMANR